MIKKTSETTPTMASVVNTTNSSTTDGYSCNYVNGQLSGLQTYSATEVDTGKTWIDGKKIYRKVYNATINNHTDIAISNFLSNVDTIINFYGGAKANKFGYPIYYKDTTDCFLCMLSEYNTRLDIQTGSSFPSTPFVATVVIEYTKSS